MCLILERTMQVDERIRRAEEIYARRRQTSGVRVPTNTVNNKREYSLFKKMIIQIVICLLIYFTFYLIKNSNYIFSNNLIEQTKNFLSYDINLQEIYMQVEDYYNKNIKNFFITNNMVNEQTENVIEANKTNTIEEINSEINLPSMENTISFEPAVLSVNDIANTEIKMEEPKQELSQMEIDANDIKANYSLILPLKGIVTSRFGEREPDDIVSAFHAGIDIGVNEGTVFIASMEGIVTNVSYDEGYGNFIQIENGDVETLYAHCSNIYLSEGDNVVQGEPVGEVGQTGRATGPHLHFEVSKNDRLVNPELLLEF